MMDNYWDSEETVGEVMKGEHTKIVFKLCKRNGKQYFMMWDHYNSANDPEWKWGAHGLTICLDNPETFLGFTGALYVMRENMINFGDIRGDQE